MHEISRFFGIVITMYFSEHGPSHFHARYSEHKAEIAIQTLSVIAGRLPPRVLGLVMEWAAMHRDELMEDWELARQRGTLRNIAPLE